MTALETLAITIAKRVRDECGAGTETIVATHTEIGEAVAEYLTERPSRALLLRALADIESAELKTRRRSRGADHG